MPKAQSPPEHPRQHTNQGKYRSSFPGSSSEVVPPSFSDLKTQYEIYRDYMKHEDDLINQRSTWHGTMQGLLFASFGVMLGWEKKSLDVRLVHSWLLIIVPCLGVFIACLAFLSCLAADRAIAKLLDEWNNQVLPFYSKTQLPIVPKIAGGGSIFAKNWGKWPSIGIPVAIALAWVIVLVNVFRSHPFKF